MRYRPYRKSSLMLPNHKVVKLSLAVVLALTGWSRAGAQGPIREGFPAQVGPELAPPLFKSLTWRSIGPANTGGRIDDFAVGRTPGQPDAIYVGAASGGVFKSTNGGTSWIPVFDGVNAMMSIGAIAVAKSNPNVVWVGTGESNNRQSSSWGDGVYKSTDAGKTWKFMGLKESRHVGRVVINPTNPDIVFVAAVGHLWGSNAERGVFKSTDGGQSWKKVLYVNENTGANDIAIDPQHPQTLFASTYQRQRKGWGFDGGGPGSGIYRSTDGGETWIKLTKGLPTGDMGRIGLDLFVGDSRIVYATIEAGGGGRGGAGGDGGVYRSSDGGETWEHLSTQSPRPSYYSQIRVDAKDRNRVYQLGSNRGFYISDDGGKNFRELFSVVHSEDHALWVDPDDPNHLLLGGDGGVSISWDRGLTWNFRDDIPVGQFYEIDVDNKVPYNVCGGLQDNGVWCAASATRDRNGLSARDAWNIGGGDGMYAKFDPTDWNIAYEESQDGNVTRVNLSVLEHQNVKPGSSERPPAGAAGRGRGGRGGGGGGGGVEGGGGYRWNWDSPILVSQSDPHVIYMAANVLFKSTDRGGSWTVISPDLTTHSDRDTLTLMGGVHVTAQTLSRNDGQSNWGSVTTIGESPLNPRVLYTGSDDGQLQVTRDGGKTWTNITSKVPGLPPYTYVSSVLPSRYAAGKVYATFDGHYQDDYRPYVYVSEDFGQTWRSIVNGLPETSVNRIREHPHDPHFLVLAHSRGVHFSNDGGATWNSLSTNMPTVPSDDAIIQERDNALIIGTHGRGLWILDDIGPLQALASDRIKGDAVLAPIPIAREMSTYSPQAWFGYGEFFAPNPEFDGSISYYVREGASAPSEITISDASGSKVRTLRGPTAAGLNRVRWDLRMDSAIPEGEMPAATGRRGGGGGGGGGRGGASSGPLVLPGKYMVTIKVPGVASVLHGEMTVDGDPAVNFSDADRRARQAIVMSVYDLQKSLVTAHIAARALVGQADSIKRDLTLAGTSGAGAKADSLTAKLTLLLGEVGRQLTASGALFRPMESWSGVPTTDQRHAVEWAIDDAGHTVDDLNRIVQTEIPALYSQLARGEWPRKVQPVPRPHR